MRAASPRAAPRGRQSPAAIRGGHRRGTRHARRVNRDLRTRGALAAALRDRLPDDYPNIVAVSPDSLRHRAERLDWALRTLISGIAGTTAPDDVTAADWPTFSASRGAHVDTRMPAPFRPGAASFCLVPLTEGALHVPIATHAIEIARLTPRLRAILAVVLIADVLDLMDSTITTTAAPTIVREIGGGRSDQVARRQLRACPRRPPRRRGSSRRPLRQAAMFLIGIAGFTLASLAVGLAIDPTTLIAARLVQGGFGALLIPQGIGILLATFPREQLPAAFSLFGPVLGGSAVLGPIAAGLS